MSVTHIILGLKLTLCSGSANSSSPASISAREGFSSPAFRSAKEEVPSPAPRSKQQESYSPVLKHTKEAPSHSRSTDTKREYSSSGSTSSSEETFPTTTTATVVSPPREANFPKTREISGSGPNPIPHSDPALWKLSRQKYGTLGDKVKLLTNCFEMKPESDLKLYRYHVNVTPEPQSARQRKRAFDLFLENAPFLSLLRRDRRVPIAAVDNRSTLITIERINPQSDRKDDRHQCQIAYYEEGKQRPKEPSINSHTFTVSFSQKLDLQEMINLLSSSAGRSHCGPMLQALDIIMAQRPSILTELAETNTGRNFLPTIGLGKLGGGLVVLRCYQTCVKMAGPRLLLNINPRTASFYQEGSLLKLMNDFRKGGKGLDEMHDFVKGIRVQVTHLTNKKGGPKIEKILGLALSPTLGANAEQVRFLLQGEETSVASYFRESKHIRQSVFHFNKGLLLISSRVYAGNSRSTCHQRWH